MPPLSLRGISRSFGRVPAVRDLTLEVADGELLVLLGPSGCGKTTTLRIVAGLERADAGAIAIGERDVTHLPPAARDVAMVFQSYALFPHMTVEANLAFGLDARGVPRTDARARVAAAAESLGIAHLLHRRPPQLSGGERQRVALGRALVREPAVFLMDEPLSNLDAPLRVQTRAEIVRLQERFGTTTVYVTHDQAEALGMGHRVGVMRDGRLEQVGTPSEVYESPANLFVATFVGNGPLTVVRARREDGRVRWAGGAAACPPGPAGDVVAAVRPEHVHVTGSRWSEAAARGETFRARVVSLASAGDQSLLGLEADGLAVTARVEPGFRPGRGEALDVWFGRVMLFDASSDEAVG